MTDIRPSLVRRFRVTCNDVHDKRTKKKKTQEISAGRHENARLQTYVERLQCIAPDNKACND